MYKYLILLMVFIVGCNANAVMEEAPALTNEKTITLLFENGALYPNYIQAEEGTILHVSVVSDIDALMKLKDQDVRLVKGETTFTTKATNQEITIEHLNNCELKNTVRATIVA